VVRRRGKPTCHCAKLNDSGHDPRLRLYTQSPNVLFEAGYALAL